MKFYFFKHLEIVPEFCRTFKIFCGAVVLKINHGCGSCFCWQFVQFFRCFGAREKKLSQITVLSGDHSDSYNVTVTSIKTELTVHTHSQINFFLV